MKKYFKINKRELAASFLAIVVILGSCTYSRPAHALIPVEDIGANSTISSIENTITAAADTVSKLYNEVTSTVSNNMWIKEYVLDPLAWAAAKSLIQSITNSTVSWINSGFKNGPAYITNPTNFFEGVADQATGVFFSGPLSALCSPISLNVRLALALNIAGPRVRGNNPYACTLSTVINNVQGATINGFEAGDFSQGGWPAFIAMGTEPQNNFYGAYFNAQADLDANIAGRSIEMDNQLNRGQGFLSYTTCVDDPTITPDEAAADPSIQISPNGTNSNLLFQRCQISTPGSVISASLNKQLGAPTDSLVAADEISEVIGALLGQLVSQVLGPGGLSGVSQPSNGVPSYLSQMQAESDAMDRNTANSAGQNFSNNQVSNSTNYATQVFNYVGASLQLVGGVRDIYNSAISACTAASNTPVISQINTEMNSSNGVNYWLGRLQPEYDRASTTLAALNAFNQAVTNVTSPADLNNLIQEFNNTNGAGYLPGPEDVSNAQTEYDQVTVLVNNTLNGRSVNTSGTTQDLTDKANSFLAGCGGGAINTSGSNSTATTTPSFP